MHPSALLRLLLVASSRLRGAAFQAGQARQRAKATEALQLLSEYSFSSFVTDFERTYEPGTDEWLKRKHVFENSLQEIIAFNSADAQSWEMGISQFMDRTDAERKAVLGYRRTPLPRSSSAALAGVQENASPQVALPVSINVELNKTFGSFVRDQGACGSCWAVAATSVLEGHMENNAEAYQQMSAAAKAKAPRQTVPTLSSQSVVSCTPNPRHCGGQGACSGATVELAYEMVKAQGLPLAVEWNYVSNTGIEPACDQKVFKKLRLGIEGYTVLPSNKLLPLKQALVESGGPMAVSVDASRWFMYRKGVYQDGAGEFTVNHAVVLTGYQDPQEGSAGWWLIKNSWGRLWGENGYIRLEMKTNEADHCGWDRHTELGIACDGDSSTAWVCGTCGILYDAVYPRGTHLLAEER